MADDLPVGGGPIHVSLYMGPKLARLVPQEVTEALLSAQITSTAGERSGFQLAFDLTKKGAIIQRLLPGGVLRSQDAGDSHRRGQGDARGAAGRVDRAAGGGGQ